MIILLIVGILLICLARAIDVMSVGRERDLSLKIFFTTCTVLGIFFVVLSLGIILSSK